MMDELKFGREVIAWHFGRQSFLALECFDKGR
jgi:hypothetical protein